MYPGRKLPFAVQFGKPGEPPPLTVSHLSNGCIVLIGPRRLWGQDQDTQEIAFADEGNVWENEDLYSKLSDLNARGLPFQYNPRSMEPPDTLMAWWQEIGKLKVSFREISWHNTEEWLITTIEPPVIGTLGWTGARPFGSYVR